MRWLRRLATLFGVLVVGLVCAAGLAAHLARTSAYTTPLKWIASRLALAAEGQQAERLRLDVQVDPEAGMLLGRAQWTVSSERENNRRFYFLLDDALRVRRVEVAGGHKVIAYQVGIVLVVDLGKGVRARRPVTLTIDYEGRPTAGLGAGADAVLNARNIHLAADQFWFPVGLMRVPFAAEVTVTLPAHFTLVHTGTGQERARAGKWQRWHWTYSRPVRGVALVGGPYRLTRKWQGGIEYRVFLDADLHLEPLRIAAEMITANQTLSERYGGAGFSTVGVYVARGLRGSHHDGSGLVGLSSRSFREGDYGFGAIARQIARNWWGATVSEDWLHRRAGGLWLTDGLAEFSRLLAIERRFGAEAAARARAGEIFDPRQPLVLADFSVVDEWFADERTLAAARAKGAYVAMMLRRVLGDEQFFGSLRGFAKKFRYRAVTANELESWITRETEVDVADFFAHWLRSADALDLGLEEGDGSGGLTLRNDGDNPVVDTAEVWIFAGGGAPKKRQVRVGEKIGTLADGAYAVVDPRALWADWRRHNNRFPRQRSPLYVAVSAAGRRATIDSEPYPWSGAVLRVADPGGREVGRWTIGGAVSAAPQWFNEHRLVFNMPQKGRDVPAVVLFNIHDGRVQQIGRGTDVSAGPGGVYAARGDRLLRWTAPSWKEETVWRFPGWELRRPRPSPAGKRVAYTAVRGNDLQVRLLDTAAGRDRVLYASDGDARALVWSPAGDRLYVAAGGDWDWQLWEIPADGAPPRAVMRDAAAMGNLAVAPQSGRIAFSAGVPVDLRNSREVFILDPKSKAVERIAVPGADPEQVAWAGTDTLIAVVSPGAGSGTWYVPEKRGLVRIHAAEGTTENVE